MDGEIALFQQILDNILKILVKAAALGVKHQMLARHGEKPLVIGLFPFFILLGGACIQPLHRLLFRAGGGKVFVVDVLFGVYQRIQQRLLGNGQQIAGDPVDAHAHGNEDAQHQGYGNGKAVGHPLLGCGLLPLEGIELVLPQAQRQRSKACQQRHANAPAACLKGHGRKGGVYLAQHRFHRADHTNEHHQLHHHGHGAEEGMVATLFINFQSFLRNGVFIAVVAELHALQLRGQRHQGNAVALHPGGNGQEDDFG